MIRQVCISNTVPYSKKVKRYINSKLSEKKKRLNKENFIQLTAKKKKRISTPIPQIKIEKINPTTSVISITNFTE